MFDFVIVLGSIVDITMNEVAVSKRGVGRTLINPTTSIHKVKQNACHFSSLTGMKGFTVFV